MKTRMPMKPALALAFGIASALALTGAHAQIYQWKDSAGRTVVSDTPPSGNGSREARVIGDQPPVTKGGAAAETANKTLAEKDLDFKKRQQEARDKAAKDAKEQEAEASRKDSCERARRTLAALEANQPMATLDEKGQRQVLDSAQRQQEMERARQFVAESCKQ